MRMAPVKSAKDLCEVLMSEDQQAALQMILTGVDVKGSDEYGNTPLHMAACSEGLKKVRVARWSRPVSTPRNV
jgi:hypothetical protein